MSSSAIVGLMWWSRDGEVRLEGPSVAGDEPSGSRDGVCRPPFEIEIALWALRWQWQGQQGSQAPRLGRQYTRQPLTPPTSFEQQRWSDTAEPMSCIQVPLILVQRPVQVVNRGLFEWGGWWGDESRTSVFGRRLAGHLSTGTTCTMVSCSWSRQRSCGSAGLARTSLELGTHSCLCPSAPYVVPPYYCTCLSSHNGVRVWRGPLSRCGKGH